MMRIIRSQHFHGLYTQRLHFHSTVPLSKTQFPAPRHADKTINLNELRKIHQKKKRKQAPANQEFLAVLNELGSHDDDGNAPSVKAAFNELQEAIVEHKKNSKKKSYSLYQLSKFVKRH